MTMTSGARRARSHIKAATPNVNTRARRALSRARTIAPVWRQRCGGCGEVSAGDPQPGPCYRKIALCSRLAFSLHSGWPRWQFATQRSHMKTSSSSQLSALMLSLMLGAAIGCGPDKDEDKTEDAIEEAGDDIEEGAEE